MIPGVSKNLTKYTGDTWEYIGGNCFEGIETKVGKREKRNIGRGLFVKSLGCCLGREMAG